MNINKIVLVFIIVLSLFLAIAYIRQPIREYEYAKFEKNSQREELVNMHNQCSEQFNERKYEEATECFRELLELKDSPTIKYNIALSLGSSKKFDEAVEILEELRKSNIKSAIFRKKIDNAYYEFLKHKNISESFKRNDIGNYFGDIKEITRWRNPRQIRVYIYNDYEKRSAIYQAFEKWNTALRSTVNFIYVRKPEDADITVKTVDISKLEGINAAGTTTSNYIYFGESKHKKYIESSQIQVSYNNSPKSPWSDEEFQGIILHEIGHALGIKGHSKHKGDIMYYDISTYRKGTISNRDVNTVKMIYGNLAY